MKKIIALALALVMALSMGVVALAAATPAPNGGWIVKNDVINDARPGTEYAINEAGLELDLKDWKISKADFTTGTLQGASLIESVKIDKEKDNIRITLKESYTMYEEAAKAVMGEITLKEKAAPNREVKFNITFNVNNAGDYVDGGRKASEATPLTAAVNYVNVVEEAGFFSFDLGELAGTFKAAKGDKIYLNTVDLATVDADEYDALVAAFGEDYEGIVEIVTFETKAAEDVAFTYEAWAEDPHFFYAWDGEKLTAIESKFDADEDVDAYVFTADAANTIVVVDEEIVLAAEETKNPDTGANDVVGVAAALAVVSLVAAGAVSLKK